MARRGVVQVRPPELSGVADRLAATAARASDLAVSGRVAHQLAAAAGEPAAVSAVASFLDSWAAGLGHLSADLRTLSGLVARAGASYDDTDRAVVEGP